MSIFIFFTLKLIIAFSYYNYNHKSKRECEMPEIITGILVIIIFYYAISKFINRGKGGKYSPEGERVYKLLQDPDRTVEEYDYIIKKMNPFAFEELIICAFKEHGYKAWHGRNYSWDKGIDGWVSYSGKAHPIQCKRYKGYVPLSLIANFSEVCLRCGTDGIFVTTGMVPKQARQYSNHVKILDGDKLFHFLTTDEVMVFMDFQEEFKTFSKEEKLFYDIEEDDEEDISLTDEEIEDYTRQEQILKDTYEENKKVLRGLFNKIKTVKKEYGFRYGYLIVSIVFFACGLFLPPEDINIIRFFRGLSYFVLAFLFLILSLSPKFHPNLFSDDSCIKKKTFVLVMVVIFIVLVIYTQILDIIAVSA